MEKRTIGKSDLRVAPLAFGGNVFGWTIDEKTSFSLLDHFVEAGFNLVDTADVYSRWVPENKGGESETIIGNWLKTGVKREKVIIATKAGSSMSADNPRKNLSRKYILQAADDSLRRLNTDYIDLYQSHYDDPETPVEETLQAYNDLVKAGKVRYIGASNFSPARLSESLRVSEERKYPAYISLQPEYNLYSRAVFEKELQPLCLRRGIGVLNYYALASGFLTGKYRSEADLGVSKRGKGITKYLNVRGLRILQALDQVADQYNTTPASVSIAWLLAQPGITAPIASATNLNQLDSLMQAVRLELDQEAVLKLNQASEEI
jgi:aryl-alcohol dehydrogenase-like predicted oxidoreductase